MGELCCRPTLNESCDDIYMDKLNVCSFFVCLFQDLQSLMDPSRNMSKYRNLLNGEHGEPPLVRAVHHYEL